MERPKVIYNKQTGKFVMWFHLELKGRGYGPARAEETRSLWSLQNSKSETWAVIPIGVGMALTAAWNGAFNCKN